MFLITSAVAAPVLAAELTVTVVDNKNIPLEDIVVYAEPKSVFPSTAKIKEKLVIDQKDKKFVPYITVIQKGQEVLFENKDDITHHIYSVSGENRFEFKLKAGASKSVDAMQATEEVAMGCNIHDWMSGFVLVVDTPYFGKTNKQGIVTFNLENTDEYKVTVWHPQLDTQTRKLSQSHIINNNNQTILMTLPKPLLPIPKQMGQEEFEFLEEY